MNQIVKIPITKDPVDIVTSLTEHLRMIEGQRVSPKPRHHFVVAGAECFLMVEKYLKSKYMFLGNDSGMFSGGRIKYSISSNGSVTFIRMDEMPDNRFYCSVDHDNYPNGVTFLLV